jgi:hypothetical protein
MPLSYFHHSRCLTPPAMTSIVPCRSFCLNLNENGSSPAKSALPSPPRHVCSCNLRGPASLSLSNMQPSPPTTQHHSPPHCIREQQLSFLIQLLSEAREKPA